MKTYLVLSMVAVLAGCSQTTGEKPTDASKTVSSRTGSGQGKKTADAASACENAVRQQTNAMAMGSALGMVGGFGGFGGRGGAVAANVASSAGGMMAQQQAARHQQDIERNCY